MVAKKMKTKQKIILSSFIILFSILSIYNMYALGYTTLNLNPTRPEEISRNNSFLHSSGKFIYTDGGDVYIYSSNGVPYGNTSLSLSEIYPFNTLKTNIFEIDSSTIGIAFSYSNTHYIDTIIYCVNINSLISQVSNKLQLHFGTGGYGYFYPSYISSVKYNNDWYIFYTIVESAISTMHYFEVVKYIYATHAISAVIDTNLGSLTSSSRGGYVGIIQDADAPKNIYLVTSLSSDVTLPKYYRIDLSTSMFELLANHPTSNRYTNDKRMCYIGGGIIYNDADTYLYFDYVTPLLSGSVRYFNIIQHRLRFNQTISTATFLDQNERIIAYTPTLPTGSTPNWVLGYAINETDMSVYYPQYLSGTYYTYEDKIKVTDWFNFGITYLTVENSTESYLTVIPYDFEDDVVNRFFANEWETDEIPSANFVYIYYDLTAIQKSYDITLSHIPNDSQLATLTRYQFSVNTYMNNVSTQFSIIGFYDGGQLFSVQTNINGLYQFYHTQTVAGYHTIQINLYDASILVRNENFTYIYSQTTTPNPSQTITLPAIDMIIWLLPPLMCIIIPAGLMAMLLSKLHNDAITLVGTLMGSLIGCFVGVQAGIIPVFLLFMLVMCVCIIFVMMVMGGKGKSESG